MEGQNKEDFQNFKKNFDEIVDSFEENVTVPATLELMNRDPIITDILIESIIPKGEAFVRYSRELQALLEMSDEEFTEEERIKGIELAKKMSDSFYEVEKAFKGVWNHIMKVGLS